MLVTWWQERKKSWICGRKVSDNKDESALPREKKESHGERNISKPLWKFSLNCTSKLWTQRSIKSNQMYLKVDFCIERLQNH